MAGGWGARGRRFRAWIRHLSAPQANGIISAELSAYEVYQVPMGEQVENGR